MILVRIDGVKGDSTLEEYKNWFTATGFEFELGENNKSGIDDEEDDDGMNENPSSRPSKKKKKSNRKNAEDWDYLELSIDKEADSASVYLMHLAMKCRANDEVPPVKVDIHVMEQKVRGDSGQLSLRPYLMIRLENAYIGGWSLDGDEKGQATESLTIWYDRAAMKYVSYMGEKSKETREVHGPLGWDLDKGIWKCDELAKS
jgi:type VI protein secretion system component Hcp